MAGKRIQGTNPIEAPVADGDTAHHDLHGDVVASAPEQAHERGYAETLHGVPTVPRKTTTE